MLQYFFKRMFLYCLGALLVSPLRGLSQPEGQQKLFIEITDNGIHIPFEKSIPKNKGRKLQLVSNKYKLQDISSSPTGFERSDAKYLVSKTLEAHSHRLRVIRNETDTMNIDLLETFNNYFIRIDFQPGSFRLFVNDGLENNWEYSVLPQKKVTAESVVYDITPKKWAAIEIKSYRNAEAHYLINNLDDSITQKLIKNASAIIPILPTNQKIEQADYNFDGYPDYRIGSVKPTTKFEYFLFNKHSNRFERDTLLSSLDGSTFDMINKTFFGYKISRIDSVTSQADGYVFQGGHFVLTQRTIQKFMGGERIDQYFYILENGQFVLKQYLKGPE